MRKRNGRPPHQEMTATKKKQRLNSTIAPTFRQRFNRAAVSLALLGLVPIKLAERVIGTNAPEEKASPGFIRGLEHRLLRRLLDRFIARQISTQTRTASTLVDCAVTIANEVSS